jgi:hypothetical protein
MSSQKVAHGQSPFDGVALRAARVSGIRAAGRLAWVRSTGAHARLLDSVETAPVPKRMRWDDIRDPVGPALVTKPAHKSYNGRSGAPMLHRISTTFEALRATSAGCPTSSGRPPGKTSRGRDSAAPRGGGQPP